MVYFECQGCSETLKKPAVRKHLNSRCRGCAVTCVDCGTCFPDPEWEAHTSCISEAKKYQGALYDASKGDKVPKGQAKQSAWTENLTKALDLAKASADSELATMMEKIVGGEFVWVES